MDASNPGELIYDTCPVCGGDRYGYSNIKLMLCHTISCPVMYFPIPQDIKTGTEVITYAGWIPEKVHGRTVYYNPRRRQI